MTKGAVIVGASHAGVQAAASLRQSGYQEPITLLSAEHDLPYHRPPLSKAFLLGEKTADQLQLRSEAFYRDQGIDLRLGQCATAIDPAARRVETDAHRFEYGSLILATGSRARDLPVPGAGLEGVYTLRSLAEARALKPALDAAASIVVIGGGFIGLEVAASVAKNGKSVRVVEAAPRLLARSVPQQVADFLADYHASRGARLSFSQSVEAIEGDGARVTGVRLANGETIAADLVVVGVGGLANTELAEAAGLALEAGGIRVDEHGRTNAPGIYAVGDCASFDNPFAGAVVRLESVQNAVDQAKAAAGHIAGRQAPLAAVPWFWTDQYDLKLQMAGVGRSGAEEILRGDPADAAWSLLHLDNGRLVACFSVNRAADHMASRKLIATGVMLDRLAAADPSVPLMRTVSEPDLRAAAQ
ncbi:NAD(P)/FAD-dependent oxidoreductase [Mesorhizobium xinjiangense]|uniref:NAD(P)/FAD-dependent oxidoreductase n=1 Tax=Mesorhizobium xinjiangense TaxID=2678685 RepID=UPI0012EDAB0F|nr:FAD-dependent oxidoreductase [Mesorhizobium xinjiangense]